MISPILFSSATDLWATPPELFAKLARRYGSFDLDVAATADKENGSRRYGCKRNIGEGIEAMSSTTTPVPTTYAPGLAWTTLTTANPSLHSWIRDAEQAGRANLGWWCHWAFDSGSLRADVSAAIGRDASIDAYRQAMGIVRAKISEAYQVAREAVTPTRRPTVADSRGKQSQEVNRRTSRRY